MSDDGTPVIFRVLIQKDAAFDKTTEEIKEALEEIFKVKVTDANPLDELTKRADVATLHLEALRDKINETFGSGAKADLTALKHLQEDLEQFEKDNQALIASSPKLKELLKATFDDAKNSSREGAEAADAYAESQRQSAKAQQENAAAIREATKANQDYVQGAKLAGTLAGASLAAAGAGLLGIVAYATQASASLDGIRARFLALKGSAEDATRAFEKAKSFAATSGFELKGIEEASLKLESFGQRAQSILPAVANLAAAKNKDLAETANLFGKAAEGDSRAFSQLARQYQVSTADLKQFGAAVDEHTGKLKENISTADQNFLALLRLTNTKFGDAAKIQAATLTGALNQTKNAVTNLADGFGQALTPSITANLKDFASLVSFIDSEMSPDFKAVLATSALVAGGLLSMAGSAVLATTGLVVMNAQLAAVATNSAAAAAGARLTGGALGFLSGSVNLVSGGMKALFATTTGAIGVLVLLAEAVADISLDKIQRESEELGRTLEEQSKKTQGTIRSYRSLVDTINSQPEVKVKIEIAGDLEHQVENISKSLNKLSDEQTVKVFEKAGFSADQLKKKYGDLAEQVDVLAAKKDKVQEAIDSFKFTEKIEDAVHNVRVTVPDTESIQKAGTLLKEFGIASTGTAADLDKLKDVVKGLGTELLSAQGSQQLFLRGMNSWEAYAKPLQEVADQAKRLKDFLHFSEQIDSAKSLAAAIHEVKEQIDAANKVPGIQGKSRDQLAASLLDPTQTEVYKSAAKAQLDNLQTLKKLGEKAADDRLKASEQAFRRREALRDVESSNDKKDLEAEAANIEEELRIKGLSVEKELHLLERRRANKLAILKQEDADQKAFIAGQIESSRHNIAEAKDGPDSTPKKTIGVIDAEIDKVRQLQLDYPKAQLELEKFEDSLKKEKGAEHTRELADNFTRLKETITTLEAEAVGSQNKLVAVGRGIELTLYNQSHHIIDQKQATQELTALGKQRLQLEEKITHEKAEQAIKLGNLEIRNRTGEIGELEKRKERGEKVDQDIKRANDAQFRDKLAQVDREKAEEIRKAGGAQDAIEIATKEASLKRTEIIRAETEREIEEYEKRRKAREESQKQHKELGFSGFGKFEIADFGQDPGTSSRYARASDAGFLGDKDQLGQQFGDDDSPAGQYRRFLAKVTAQANTRSQGTPPIVAPPDFLSTPIGYKQDFSAFEKAHQSAIRNFNAPSIEAEKLRAERESKPDLAALPKPAPAAASSVIHIYVDGKSQTINRKQFAKQVNQFIEDEGFLVGPDRPPGAA